MATASGEEKSEVDRSFVFVLAVLAVFGFGYLGRDFLLALLIGAIFKGVLFPVYRRIRSLARRTRQPGAPAHLGPLPEMIEVLLEQQFPALLAGIEWPQHVSRFQNSQRLRRRRTRTFEQFHRPVHSDHGMLR